MNKQIAELLNKRAGLLNEAEQLARAGSMEDYAAKMKEVEGINDQINGLKMIDAERGRFDKNDIELVSASEALAQQKQDEELERSIDSVRSSKEYARAFAYALKNNIRPGSEHLRYEKVAPLLDALTIAGGDPVGEDGGFLVPIDMDNMIIEVKRDNRPLAPLFTTEMVNTATGWRVMDTAPTTGFTKLSGELGSVPADDQPMFAKVPYSLDTYGLYVPMSRELLDDEVANLMAYLARWIGKKEVITENLLLIAQLQALTEVDLTANSEFAEIKAVLTKGLNPAFRKVAGFITNQSGLALLDGLEDLNGRPLMQPDVTEPTEFRISGRPVTDVIDGLLPNVGTTKSPIYIGDFKSYAVLFRRKAIEVAGTDVGGDAWRKYGYEVRAITRLDAVTFDTAAVKGVNFIHP
jgi:HK97 family phage major capsid protein